MSILGLAGQMPCWSHLASPEVYCLMATTQLEVTSPSGELQSGSKMT